jgi:predicted small lipoprotein YifL
MRPLLLVLSVALALTGCSGSSTPAALPPTATATPSETATAAPTPSAVPTTPAPIAGGTARATPTATGGTVRPAADGDVDGDGKTDAVSTTATVVTVTLSGSGRRLTAAVHSDDPRPPAYAGSHDVDRDGRAEVFLRTAQGASTSFVTPYRFDGTRLVELLLDGDPARLGIGGAVTHGDGFACLAGGLLDVKAADSSDGKSYTVTDRFYRVGGAALLLVRSAISHSQVGTPALEASYTADCGSVTAGD